MIARDPVHISVMNPFCYICIKLNTYCLGMILACIWTLAISPAFAAADQDSSFHYYVNGSVSVAISPWQDGERSIVLYDLYGNESYRMVEAKRSYSVHVDLRFHENGALREALISSNPGASMYSYKSRISFDSTNTPLHRHDTQEPVMSLEDAEGKKYFWHRKQNRWAEKEIVKCMPGKE